jgi:PhnB protein
MTTETDLKPFHDATFRGVIAYIQVDHAGEAVEFYKKALGAKELTRTSNDAGTKIMNCQLEINGGVMMVMDSMPENGFPFQPTGSLTLQLLVDEGQAWFDRAVAAGCKVETPFQKMFWGDQWGSVSDPFQMRWAFNEPAAK